MISAVTKSASDTQALGEAFSSVLVAGDVVLLLGDMGAGKTTFVKGLGKAFGVDEPITSPTFVLLHTYDGKMPLHHADLYRLDQLDEVLELGIMELVENGVALIEWADRGLPAFPSDVLHIEFAYDEADESVRHFTFRSMGESWTNREPQLVESLGRWSK